MYSIPKVSDLSFGLLLSKWARAPRCPAVVVANGDLLDADYTELNEPVPVVVDGALRALAESRPMVISGTGVTAGGAGVTVTTTAAANAVGDWGQPVLGALIKVTYPEGVAPSQVQLTLAGENAHGISLNNAILMKPEGNTPGATEVGVLALFGEDHQDNRFFMPAHLREAVAGAGPLAIAQDLSVAIAAGAPDNIALSVLYLTRGVTQMDRFRSFAAKQREAAVQAFTAAASLA